MPTIEEEEKRFLLHEKDPHSFVVIGAREEIFEGGGGGGTASLWREVHLGVVHQRRGHWTKEMTQAVKSEGASASTQLPPPPLSKASPCCRRQLRYRCLPQAQEKRSNRGEERRLRRRGSAVPTVFPEVLSSPSISPGLSCQNIPIFRRERK